MVQMQGNITAMIPDFRQDAKDVRRSKVEPLRGNVKVKGIKKIFQSFISQWMKMTQILNKILSKMLETMVFNY